MNSRNKLALERIAMQGASVIYDGNAIGMQDISLEVVKGQSIVILGQSGAGKSTLLRVMAGIQAPTDGSVSWHTENGALVEKLWPELSVVFQKFFLWPHLTIRENLMLPLRSRFGGEAALDKELLGVLRLENLLDRYSYELSVGQQQRVALARSILLKPKFLLVDEISSALDPESTFEVYSLLRSLHEDGVTVVAITHLPGLAINYFEEYIYLHQGAAIGQGATDSLNKASDPRILRYLEMASANQR